MFIKKTMKITDSEVAKKLCEIKHNAEMRGIPFNLSFKTVKRLLGVRKCYYTGVRFTHKIGYSNSRTFERLDNNHSKGYIEGNVVVACKLINDKKGDLSLKEITSIYNGIKHLI